MRSYAKAFEKSFLNTFTMESLYGPNMKAVSGRIDCCNDDELILKITDGFEADLSDRSFKLTFHMDRVNFQMQHYTLNWIREHKLFHILINHHR